MKRVGYLYEKVCSPEILDYALTMACKHKRKTKAMLRILENREKTVAAIREMLITETYVPSENRIKIIHDVCSGKERKIEIPRFYPDRIIHWAVCIVLNPIFMKGMYRWCVGSVPRRGGEAGIRYVSKVMKKDKKIRYAMKLDIKKFFQSVSNVKAKQLFRKKIKDYKMLNLLDLIIDAGSEGLPIGYYTSQWFSNFYLEKTDHFLKETRRMQHYVRNVDDMQFFGTNKRKLRQDLIALKEFLQKDDWAVTIKKNYAIWKLHPRSTLHSRPVDFLGYKFYVNGKKLLRNKNFNRLRRRVRRVQKRGYCTIRGARGIMSGFGLLKRLPHGRHYYLNHIKPIISKRRLRQIISTADRRRNLLQQGA